MLALTSDGPAECWHYGVMALRSVGAGGVVPRPELFHLAVNVLDESDDGDDGC